MLSFVLRTSIFRAAVFRAAVFRGLALPVSMLRRIEFRIRGFVRDRLPLGIQREVARLCESIEVKVSNAIPVFVEQCVAKIRHALLISRYYRARLRIRLTPITQRRPSRKYVSFTRKRVFW